MKKHTPTESSGPNNLTSFRPGSLTPCHPAAMQNHPDPQSCLRLRRLSPPPRPLSLAFVILAIVMGIGIVAVVVQSELSDHFGEAIAFSCHACTTLDNHATGPMPTICSTILHLCYKAFLVISVDPCGYFGGSVSASGDTVVVGSSGVMFLRVMLPMFFSCTVIQ
jgi:hypothetical protein